MSQVLPPGHAVRRRITVGALLVAAAGLAWRAVDLQLTRNDFLRDRGDARYLRVVAVPAHRGMITDRHGEPLAISTPVSSVWAAPRRLLADRSRWPQLAAALGTNVEHLRAVVEPRADREFVYLKRHVPPALAAQVAALGVDGVALTREYRRYYPTGEVTAHVLGFTNVDDVGQEGLELAFDAELRGIEGAKRVIKDNLGRVVENVESIRAPEPGRTLRLSIDKRVQYVAYRELKAAVQLHRARGGAIVVLDAQSGEVLAMANQPSFNPNNRSQLEGAYYRNRAVTDLFEPGSTAKPFTIAAALESGLFTTASRIDTTPGRFAIGRHTIQDLHDYGVLDLAGVIVRSSNVGAAKIALALDAERLWRTLHAVGFGRPTALGFPGESAGKLNDYEDWREIEQATLAFGYGLSATPVQLASAYAVLAAGGRRLPLTLLAREGRPVGERVLSARVADELRGMLEGVVTAGTGKRAGVPGYRIAGKTGTVHKAGVQGYAEDRYVSLFAGFTPASRPRLVAVVVIDEPRAGEYFGGTVAAPVFSAVIRETLRLLNVPPDDLPVPTLAAAGEPGALSGP